MPSGNYLLEVKNYNGQSAGYTLKTNFQVAKKDDRQFSIKIVYSEALRQFKGTSNMLEDAARFWERAITHTTLDHVHTLRIVADTADLPDKVAEGSFTSKDLEKDKNGHAFPVAGTITYDNDSVNQISINRRIAIHEMAYILGLVAVSSDFFDAETSTYKAKSYAGWAYGELLGSYKQTAIPMIGKEYWDYIEFPNEALNASAGPPNGLVSQVTIAALRDMGWNVNYGAADNYSLTIR